MTDSIVVLVTCANSGEARRMARALVKARLAACVNIAGAPVESVYWWKGKMETAREHLLVIKSTRQRFAALCREVRRLHSYDIPEVIALPIVSGLAAYLKWLGECVAAGRGVRARRKGK